MCETREMHGSAPLPCCAPTSYACDVGAEVIWRVPCVSASTVCTSATPALPRVDSHSSSSPPHRTSCVYASPPCGRLPQHPEPRALGVSLLYLHCTGGSSGTTHSGSATPAAVRHTSAATFRPRQHRAPDRPKHSARNVTRSSGRGCRDAWGWSAVPWWNDR